MATYITEAELTTYCDNRGITVPNTPLILIQKATDYITATFYDCLIGTKQDETQELLFPRIDEDGDIIDEVSLKKAVCSLSLRANSEDLFQDRDKRVVKEKLEGLEVQYSDNGTDIKRFTDVYNYMRPYLLGSGTAKRVIRT